MLKQIKTKTNRNNKLTLEQKEQMILEYKSGVQPAELARTYDVTTGSICQLLRRRGIQTKQLIRRKHTFNENYFEKIDTEEKAYIFGYLMADGWVIYREKPAYYQVGMELQIDDVEILNKLSLLIGYSSKLEHKKRKKPTHKDKCCIRLNSQKMCQDLMKLGMIPRKSLVLQFPTSEQVPNELIHHFIRGYFDGDGTITFSKRSDKHGNIKRNIYFSLVSSLGFCQSISDILLEKFNVKVKVSHIKNNRIKKLTVGGNKQVIAIFDWLYKNCNICLDRKKNKFVDFLEEYSKFDFTMDRSLSQLNREEIFNHYI